jgi:uncharacterized protein (DUF488 family)
MTVYTVGHGTQPVEELVTMLRNANVQSLVDVRRYPGSRRNPQFNRDALEETLASAAIRYVHAEALGGRLSGEPGEGRFACIRTAAFRSYAARMGTDEWKRALAAALAEPTPCVMCAETDWRRCHRQLIASLLVARGIPVLHLAPGRREPHRLPAGAEARDGRLYICGELVA